MLAIVAPGQGAQTPGFLTPWLADSAFSALIDSMSAAGNLDLRRYGTTADAETIRDTAVAQPLLVAAGLCVARQLLGGLAEVGHLVGVIAGHSVGEITAAGVAGVLRETDAVIFASLRGRGMAAASAVGPTSMAAVVGGQADDVLTAIASCGLTAANFNGKGQIVAAGTLPQLDCLSHNPPAGARIVPLSVAGAFHTVHMQPAVAALAELAEDLSTSMPVTRLLSNADGAVVDSGADYLARLVRQITNPVRWDLCMRTMTELKVTGLLELAPAGTLTGIAKRNMGSVDRFSLNSPDQLDEARQFVARHAGNTMGDV